MYACALCQQYQGIEYPCMTRLYNLHVKCNVPIMFQVPCSHWDKMIPFCMKLSVLQCQENEYPAPVLFAYRNAIHLSDDHTLFFTQWTPICKWHVSTMPLIWIPLHNAHLCELRLMHVHVQRTIYHFKFVFVSHMHSKKDIQHKVKAPTTSKTQKLWRQ